MNALKIPAALALIFLFALPSQARSTDHLLGEINPPGKEGVPCMIKITSEGEIGSPQFFELTYKSGESLRTDVFRGQKNAGNSIAAQDALQKYVLTGVFGDDAMEAVVTDPAGKVVFMITAGKGEAVLKDSGSAASDFEKPAADIAAPTFLESAAPVPEKPETPKSGSAGKTVFIGKLYENDASSFPLKAEITASEGGSCEIVLSYKESEEKFTGTLDKNALQARDASGNTLNCSLIPPDLKGVKLTGGTYQAYYFQAQTVGAAPEIKTDGKEPAERPDAKNLTLPVEKIFQGKFKEKDRESLLFVLRISIPEKGIREFLFTTFKGGVKREVLLLGAMDETYFKAALPLDDGGAMIAKGRFKGDGVTGSLFHGSELIGSFSAVKFDNSAPKKEVPKTDIAPFWKGEIEKGGETLSLRLSCGRNVISGRAFIYITYIDGSSMNLASFSGEIKGGTFSAQNNRVFQSELESIKGTYAGDDMEGEITFSSGEKASFRARKSERP